MRTINILRHTYHFGCWLTASMPCFSFNANQKGICLQKIQNIDFHINNLGDKIKTVVNDIRMNLLTSLLVHSFTHSIPYPLTHHVHTHMYTLTHSIQPCTPYNSHCLSELYGWSRCFLQDLRFSQH